MRDFVNPILQGFRQAAANSPIAAVITAIYVMAFLAMTIHFLVSPETLNVIEYPVGAGLLMTLITAMEVAIGRGDFKKPIPTWVNKWWVGVIAGTLCFLGINTLFNLDGKSPKPPSAPTSVVTAAATPTPPPLPTPDPLAEFRDRCDAAKAEVDQRNKAGAKRFNTAMNTFNTRVQSIWTLADAQEQEAYGDMLPEGGVISYGTWERQEQPKCNAGTRSITPGQSHAEDYYQELTGDPVAYALLALKNWSNGANRGNLYRGNITGNASVDEKHRKFLKSLAESPAKLDNIGPTAITFLPLIQKVTPGHHMVALDSEVEHFLNLVTRTNLEEHAKVAKAYSQWYKTVRAPWEHNVFNPWTYGGKIGEMPTSPFAPKNIFLNDASWCGTITSPCQGDTGALTRRFLSNEEMGYDTVSANAYWALQIAHVRNLPSTKDWARDILPLVKKMKGQTRKNMYLAGIEAITN